MSDRSALYHTAPRFIAEFWLDLWFTRTVLLLDKSGFNCVLRCLSEVGPLAGVAFFLFVLFRVIWWIACYAPTKRSTKPDELTPTKAQGRVFVIQLRS